MPWRMPGTSSACASSGSMPTSRPPWASPSSRRHTSPLPPASSTSGTVWLSALTRCTRSISSASTRSRSLPSASIAVPGSTVTFWQPGVLGSSGPQCTCSPHTMPHPWSRRWWRRRSCCWHSWSSACCTLTHAGHGAQAVVERHVGGGQRAERREAVADVDDRGTALPVASTSASGAHACSIAAGGREQRRATGVDRPVDVGDRRPGRHEPVVAGAVASPARTRTWTPSSSSIQVSRSTVTECVAVPAAHLRRTGRRSRRGRRCRRRWWGRCGASCPPPSAGARACPAWPTARGRRRAARRAGRRRSRAPRPGRCRRPSSLSPTVVGPGRHDRRVLPAPQDVRATVAADRVHLHAVELVLEPGEATGRRRRAEVRGGRVGLCPGRHRAGGRRRARRSTGSDRSTRSSPAGRARQRQQLHLPHRVVASRRVRPAEGGLDEPGASTAVSRPRATRRGRRGTCPSGRSSAPGVAGVGAVVSSGAGRSGWST